MEILAVDDDSVRDDPEQVVRGDGAGQLRLVRQELNGSLTIDQSVVAVR